MIVFESIEDFLKSNESMLVEQEKLNLAAGFVIIQNNKILLVHPTNSKWKGTFSFPKGHLEKGENFLDAAIRETKEETGVEIDTKDITSGPHFIDYVKKDKIYKRVYYYVVYPSIPISKKDFKLQKKEVDWAGFLSKKEAKKKILWRLKEILKYLK